MRKNWPRIQQKLNRETGKERWLVDGRFNIAGKTYGRRHWCQSAAEAERLHDRLRKRRAEEGARPFEFGLSDLEELKAARAKLASTSGDEGETVLEAVSELAQARAILASSPGSVIDAANAFAREWADKATLENRTISEVVDQFRSDKENAGVSDHYRAELRIRLATFSADFGRRRLGDIEPAEIEDWLASLKVIQRGRSTYGQPLSAQARNNFRRVLSALFAYGVKRKYCSRNPVEDVPKARVVKQEPGILTVEETRSLLTHASVEILPFLAIGAFAGIRPSEIRRLRWENVDLEQRLILVRAEHAKTAKHRLVVISENLAAWLMPLAKKRGKLVNLSEGVLRERHQQARALAKIDRWPANALRHGFASYHLALHQDAAALSLEMGHSTTELIFSNYRALVKPAEAKAYWEIFPDGSPSIGDLESGPHSVPREPDNVIQFQRGFG